jgi:hypothetical protein
LAGVLIALGGSVALMFTGFSAATVGAAAPPGPYFNGFENNTAGWFDGGDRNLVRRPSGWVPTSGSGYANGVPSAAGHWHARLEDTTGCTLNCDGPFTRWGGYSATFPSGGYLTQLDIYLDTAWAATNHSVIKDYRVDWISSINDNTGNFKRDFVFNIGTTPTGFIIQSSTNSTRSGANPNSPCPAPNLPPNTCRPAVSINTSGWYSFRHTFRDGGDGYLDVDFDIFALGQSTPIAHQTIDGNHAPFSDPMTSVGGNRYGWFSNEEIPDLPIDNSLRTGLCRSGGGDGDVEDKESGRHGHMHFNGNGCEGGQQGGDVEEQDQNSGDNFQSNNVSSTTFTSGEDSQTMSMVGTGVHNGIPVAFTMVAIDYGTLAPALFSLVLSDGYAIYGLVTSGSISIP